ncbi:MAG TPA: glycosyltransferase [Elusimicrobiales bacterium]|nr:glycosyltransferase [Elusimicrobiales bacterium]
MRLKILFWKARLFFYIAVAAICVYFISRVILFTFWELTLIERFMALLLLLAESFLLVHATGFILSVLRTKKPKHQVPMMQKMQSHPQVAIVVAARHEPKHILQETFTTLTNLNYPNKNIYLLDDSSDSEYIRQADEIAKEFGIKVFRREKRHGAKAGVINDALKNMDEKYLAIFDSDQNAMPDFLERTIPVLEQDSNISFVQTPQFYTNIAASPVAEGAAMQQAIFYEGICEGKNEDNAMFCCGTNVVFNVKALRDVDGFDETSVTEDFATSVKLHLKGYRSVYYNHACVFGMAPETLYAYFRQQSRWAAGSIGVFRKIIKHFFTAIRKLSPLQWWEYFLASTFYFIGWVYFILMLSPVIYLIFGIPSYFMYPEVYIGTFIPYFVLMLMIFYTSMRDRYYKVRQIYYGLILGYVSYPILMKAALFGLFGRKLKFQKTVKGKNKRLNSWQLLPFAILILFNFAAIVAGLYKFDSNPFAIGVNMFWAGLHLFLMSSIFHYNYVGKIK